MLRLSAIVLLLSSLPSLAQATWLYCEGQGNGFQYSVNVGRNDAVFTVGSTRVAGRPLNGQRSVLGGRSIEIYAEGNVSAGKIRLYTPSINSWTWYLKHDGFPQVVTMSCESID